MKIEMSWKRTLSLALLAFALVAMTISTVADEEERREIKLVLNLDGDSINIETDDLDIGETRYFSSESGKDVVLMRTEEGMSLEVDGEPINLDLAGDHIDASIGDHAHRKVIVHKTKHGEDVDVHHLIDGDHDVDVHVMHLDPAQRLLDSGVLDDLDSETRQRILDVLSEPGEHGKSHRVIKIINIEEEHTEDNGGE